MRAQKFISASTSLLIALCAFVVALPAYATTQNGIDTAPGVASLPLAVEGTAVITLSPNNVTIGGIVSATGVITSTATPNVSWIGAITAAGGGGGTQGIMAGQVNNTYWTGVAGQATAANGIGVYGAATNVLGYGGYFTNSAGGPSLIAKGGNVGIGTTNPAYTLDVTGTANVTTSVTIGGSVANNATINAANSLSNLNCAAGQALNKTATGGLQCIDVVDVNGSPTTLAACPGGEVLTSYDGKTFTCVAAPVGPQGPAGANGAPGPQGPPGPGGAAVPSPGTMAGYCSFSTSTSAHPGDGVRGVISPAQIWTNPTNSNDKACSCETGWTSVVMGNSNPSCSTYGHDELTTCTTITYYSCIKN